MFKLNEVFLEDCIKGIKSIEDNSIDIIIVDPPYYQAIEEDWDNQWKDIYDYQNWCSKWVEECKRVLKDTGTMFIYGYEPQLAYISTLLEMNKQRWLVWYYTNKTVPSLNFWQHSHESIICYSSDNRIFNKDLVREPYTDSYVKNCKDRVRPSSSTARFGSKETTYNVNELGALPRDVISVSTLAGGASLKERIIYCEDCNQIINPKERNKHTEHNLIIHPTQKPYSLTEKLIKSCKPEGNFNVLIPFAGSGSECKVVKELNGNYIGFETNEKYWKLAKFLLKF